MLPPRGISTAHMFQNNINRAIDVPNVINYAKFEINRYRY